MNYYKSNETFSLWDYNVSHQTLLLRCNGIEHEKFTNIDVIFTGVFFINIPTLLKGIELYESNELRNNYFPIGKEHQNDNFFVIKSQGKEYLIAALAYSVFYNDLDFDVSSLNKQAENNFLIVTS